MTIPRQTRTKNHSTSTCSGASTKPPTISQILVPQHTQNLPKACPRHAQSTSLTVQIISQSMPELRHYKINNGFLKYYLCNPGQSITEDAIVAWMCPNWSMQTMMLVRIILIAKLERRTMESGYFRASTPSFIWRYLARIATWQEFIKKLKAK